MTVDRKKWTSGFERDGMPRWPCPHCAEGVLEQKKSNALIQEELASSIADREEHHPGDWEPDWYRGHFVAQLVCSHCREFVAMAGKTGFSYRNGPEGQTAEMYFLPTLFAPSPPLFHLPDHCHPEVRAEVTRAWNLFWADLAACANRVRACVERVLTDEGIKRFVRKNHHLSPLSLHARIELYRLNEPELAESMMAVKWLGNVGSHGSAMPSQTDILNGFDLLEDVLSEIYGRRTKELKRIQRDLIRRKGKPKKATVNTG